MVSSGTGGWETSLETIMAIQVRNYSGLDWRKIGMEKSGWI